MLREVLGAHSRIYSIPEETWIAQGDRQRFRTALTLFNKQTIIAGKHRWVEKTPKHICHIKSILEECPDAKIVIVIRDGNDVAASIKARTGDLSKGAQRWVEDNLAGKQYWDHSNVCVVKYEDVVRDFEVALTPLMAFLSEEYEPGMRDFHRTARGGMDMKKEHGRQRNWQVTQPLFDGRGRWRELSVDELTAVDDIAGELLSELGYSRQVPVL